MRLIVVCTVFATGVCRGDDLKLPITLKEAASGTFALFDGHSTFGWKATGPVRVEEDGLHLGGAEATTLESTSEFCFGRLTVRAEGDVAKLERLVNGLPIPQTPTTTDRLLTTSSTRQTGGVGRDRFGFRVPAGAKVTLKEVSFQPRVEKSLFNGRDLSGWKEVKGKDIKSKYTVLPDGLLNVKDGQGDLQTVEQFDDFVLQLDVLSNGDHLNSGIFYRALPGQKWSGYEAQIRNEWKGNDRSQPVDFGTGAIYRRQATRRVVSTDREWFTMTIVVHGNHHAIWVNGYQTVDFTDTRPAADNGRNGNKTTRGVISIQGHDKTTDLSFRNIRIAELPKPSAAKTPATATTPAAAKPN